MNFKEYLKSMIYEFFMVTTFVNFAIFILGKIYMPEQTFSYEVFLFPPLFGFLGTLPSLLFYSKKEISVKKTILRRLIHLLLLEIILTAFNFRETIFLKENLKIVISFSASVFVIYIAVNVVEWLLDKKNADKIMKDLSEYQKKFSESSNK